MKRHKHIIIAGIQGCGKGTQARLLEKAFGWVHIGTGALCRWHLDHKTLFGKELSGINRGNLASDDLMIRIVERRLQIHDPDYTFILDGFPRNIKQAEYLFKHYQFSAAIFLELGQEAAMQRAQGRRDAKQVRKDDNEEALRKRFNLFHKHTEPTKDLYREMGILHEIDGSSAIENVFSTIVDSLRAKKVIPDPRH